MIPNFQPETEVTLTVYDSTGGKVRIWRYNPANISDFIEDACDDGTKFVGFDLDGGTSQTRIAADRIVRIDVDWELSLRQQLAKTWYVEYQPKVEKVLDRVLRAIGALK